MESKSRQTWSFGVCDADILAKGTNPKPDSMRMKQEAYVNVFLSTE